MKSLIFLTLGACLTAIPGAHAQTYTISVNQTSDYVNNRAFQRMQNFISADFTTIKNSQPIDEALKANQGENRLYAPTHANPNVYPTETNNSYDNFLPSVYVKDPLAGSPFLLPYYVQGLVLTSKDSVLDKPGFLYNYDKMSGNFLLEKGNEAPIAVDRDQVKAFCLKADKGGYIFERVPFINNDEFFQVIYKGTKYSFYKLYKSKFIASHKTTNGYLTEGNNYDEYQDILTYYVIDHRKKETSIFELKKYSVRKVLSADEAIVNQYFKENKVLDIDDVYLARLADAVNK